MESDAGTNPVTRPLFVKKSLVFEESESTKSDLTGPAETSRNIEEMQNSMKASRTELERALFANHDLSVQVYGMQTPIDLFECTNHRLSELAAEERSFEYSQGAEQVP